MSLDSPTVFETIALAFLGIVLYLSDLAYPIVGFLTGIFSVILVLAGLGWGLRRLNSDPDGDEQSPICWYCGQAFPDMAGFKDHVEECKQRRRALGTIQKDTEEKS